MVMKKWTVEMKDIRDVLLLAVKGRYSAREIATSLGISHQSVTRYLAKIEAAGLSIESSLQIDDETLEGICHPNRPGPKSGSKAKPDIAKILEELSVCHAPTRKVLYDEYRASNEGQNCYSYSQFTVMIKQDSKANNLTMHIEHIPGDKLFIDFAGDTVPIYLAPGAPTAEFEAQIFVATLAYSGETFCCATRHQDVASVIDALQQSLYAFGGVTARIVPDNMATAVIATKAKKGALKLNPSFLEFANHVGAMVAPTRVRRPKDKAKVEQMVGYIQREVLARFRHRRFLSIQELNDAILPEIRRLNTTNLQSQNFSRHDCFIETERDQLLALPRSKFNFGTWSTIRARSDYHVKVGTSYYSVPWRLANIRLRVKLTVNTVEIYQANTPVALHARSMVDGSYTTVEAHMTANHLGYTRSNSVPHLLEKIALIGPSATAFAELVLSNHRAEGLAISSLVQITDVARKYSSSAAEASCAHALHIGATKSSSVESIARRSLYESDPCDQTNTATIAHENIRGPHYYQGDGNVS